MNLDSLSPEEPKPLSAALGALSKGELGPFGLFKFGGTQATQAPIENLSIDVYIDMQ